MIDDKNFTRTFICIEFPDSVIKEIARIQEVLSRKKFTGKMTELGNLHLTLKFLGEIDVELLGKVKERLKGIKFHSFEAKLGELGTFMSYGKPKIVWVKLYGDGIWTLQKMIDSALEDLFKKEERFMSHITIARVKHVKDSGNFIDYVKNIGTKEVKFSVDGFKIKSSVLERLRPIYKDIAVY